MQCPFFFLRVLYFSQFEMLMLITSSNVYASKLFATFSKFKMVMCSCLHSVLFSFSMEVFFSGTWYLRGINCSFSNSFPYITVECISKLALPSKFILPLGLAWPHCRIAHGANQALSTHQLGRISAEDTVHSLAPSVSELHWNCCGRMRRIHWDWGIQALVIMETIYFFVN